MVPAKERNERCASIRRHVLLYGQRNDLSELDKALAELKILMDLAKIATPPLGDDLLAGVIPDLTDAEVEGFTAAIEEGRR